MAAFRSSKLASASGISRTGRRSKVAVSVNVQVSQIAHDHVGALVAQRLFADAAVDADDVLEVAGRTGFDADGRVLDHRGVLGLYVQQLARPDIGVGGGLAGQAVL